MPDSTNTSTGTIVNEPELRWMQNGKAVCNFRIAVAHRYQRNNEWVEETTFLAVATYGSLAENIPASCSKGTRVIVMGRLQQRDFETQQGEKRTVIELLAEDVAPSLKWATALVEKNPRRAQ